MLKYIIPLSMAFLVILSSGCTTTQQGSGVSIQEFVPDQSVVYPGEKVTFRVLMKNTGSEEATQVFAEMLELDNTWCNPITHVCGAEEAPPQPDECSYKQGKITLLPPNQEMGVQGQTQVCSWTYTVPEATPGVSMGFTPKVRVYFGYKTNTIKTVTLVPRDEIITYADSGRSLPSETKSTSTSPISIDISTDGPVKLLEGGFAFPVKFTITNAGGGTPCLDSYQCKTQQGNKITDLGRNRFHMKITLSGGLSLQSCKEDNEIYIVPSEKKQEIICQIKADSSGTINTGTIQATAEYGYFVDYDTQIKVLPLAQKP